MLRETGGAVGTHKAECIISSAQSNGGGIDNSNRWQELAIENMHGTGNDAEMMDLDAGYGHGQHKRSHLAMQLQTSGIGRCFRISPTTVLDNDSEEMNGDGDGSEKMRNEEGSDNSKKRRKTPDDAPLIVTMSSSEVMATIVQRFSLEGTQITKVTLGTYGRDCTKTYFGSQCSDYVSVHFCSADGKRWGELRTTDGTHALHHIGDAALPSIQAYLRSAK